MRKERTELRFTPEGVNHDEKQRKMKQGIEATLHGVYPIEWYIYQTIERAKNP